MFVIMRTTEVQFCMITFMITLNAEFLVTQWSSQSHTAGTTKSPSGPYERWMCCSSCPLPTSL